MSCSLALHSGICEAHKCCSLQDRYELRCPDVHKFRLDESAEHLAMLIAFL